MATICFVGPYRPIMCGIAEYTNFVARELPAVAWKALSFDLQKYGVPLTSEDGVPPDQVWYGMPGRHEVCCANLITGIGELNIPHESTVLWFQHETAIWPDTRKFVAMLRAIDMPKLVKGAKWTYGWVVVGSKRGLAIPPEAWRGFGFQSGVEAVFLPGSSRSGGFALGTPDLIAKASERMAGVTMRELGRGWFGEGGWVTVPPQVGVKPGDRLLTVRGSCYGLGFVERGPIYEEALKHPDELEEIA